MNPFQDPQRASVLPPVSYDRNTIQQNRVYTPGTGRRVSVVVRGCESPKTQWMNRFKDCDPIGLFFSFFPLTTDPTHYFLFACSSLNIPTCLASIVLHNVLAVIAITIMVKQKQHNWPGLLAESETLQVSLEGSPCGEGVYISAFALDQEPWSVTRPMYLLVHRKTPANKSMSKATDLGLSLSLLSCT